jgi:hypothetical protein
MINRVTIPPSKGETLRSLVEASSIRFAESNALLSAGFCTGSVYLGGYVVEMLLKVAYFKTKNIHYEEEITKSMRSIRQLVPDGFQTSSGEVPTSLHDLEGLYNLLMSTRTKYKLINHDQIFFGLFNYHLRKISSSWSVDLRYSTLQIDQRMAH